MPIVTVAIAGLALAQVPQGAVRLDFDNPVALTSASVPVTYQGNKLSIVSLTSARFAREDFHLDLAFLNKPEVPPGIYGVRWGHMPPKVELDQPIAKILQGPFLRVTVSASVAQYTDVDYKLCCAVFDKQGRLLGAANHTENVRYVRLGQMPTIFREITFDFGASKAFAGAAYAAFSISEPVVPVPPDGG